MAEREPRSGPGGSPDTPPDTVRLETPDGGSVSSTVVLAVEELTGTSVEELPPLGMRIDADALDALFRPCLPGTQDTASGAVQFRYADCIITVDSAGTVVTRRSVESEPADHR